MAFDWSANFNGDALVITIANRYSRHTLGCVIDYLERVKNERKPNEGTTSFVQDWIRQEEEWAKDTIDKYQKKVRGAFLGVPVQDLSRDGLLALCGYLMEQQERQEPGKG